MIFGVGSHHKTVVQHGVYSFALQVVAIPEGLPLAVTISLAYSVMKMLEDNNLVRHLSAAETMGTATVICTDKTGTLTQNKMAVTKLWLAGDLIDLSSQQYNSLDDLSSSLDVSDDARLESLENAFDTFHPTVKELLCDGIVLNSTATVYQDKNGRKQSSGNRTEVALLKMMSKIGCDENCSLEMKNCQSELHTSNIVGQKPFTSDRKRMSSIILMKPKDSNDEYVLRLYVKGAAEVVLSMCATSLQGDGSVAQLTESGRKSILDEVHGGGLRCAWSCVFFCIYCPFDAFVLFHTGPAVVIFFSFAGYYCRLLCLAYKDISFSPSDEQSRMCQITGGSQALFTSEEIEDMENDLTAIAVAGISDPLRPEVPEAIKNCKKGGISVKMFTGDNAITAEAIARNCGIIDSLDHNPNVVMESNQFIKSVLNESGNIDGAKFVDGWEKMRVLARCSPTDKFTIVEALKQYTDEIVAVTGDGTNDAPALRAANIGFAMNDGTQVAKEAADIILVDNNFASTVSAALWGRNVYANVSKFLQFQLTVNMVAVITAAGGAIASAESPLTTVQMLWVNLIMDSLASLALTTGTPDSSLLEEKPYSQGMWFLFLGK